MEYDTESNTGRTDEDVSEYETELERDRRIKTASLKKFLQIRLVTTFLMTGSHDQRTSPAVRRQIRR